MAARDTGQTSLVKAAMSAPYLDRDEEHQLAVSWKENQDQTALHKLTVAHMRLVISVASRFRHFGLSMNDLIQEGHVGLLEAAARFEPDRQVRFSTYATWWIRASIQDHILRNWSIVRGGTSSAQKTLFFNLRRLRAKIAQSGDRLPERGIYEEIAQSLNVSAKDVEMMDSRLSAPDQSLNAPLTDTEGSSSDRQDFLPSEAPTPDVEVEQAIDTERRGAWLVKALEVLNERELRIVQERRLSEDSTTLEALGHAMGISKERVRQIENRALEKLKVALLKQDVTAEDYVTI